MKQIDFKLSMKLNEENVKVNCKGYPLNLDGLSLVIHRPMTTERGETFNAQGYRLDIAVPVLNCWRITEVLTGLGFTGRNKTRLSATIDAKNIIDKMGIEKIKTMIDGHIKLMESNHVAD